MSTLYSSETASVHIRFDDNNLLPLLFGAHDRHLARIEQQLDVSLASRGNHITIAGPAAAAETARTALRNLYKQIKDGESVKAQSCYIKAIQEHDMVFAIGPAGTGKTYLAVCAAVEMFNAGKIDRIVLSRPAVEAGERLGFLPGDMQEKIDPYLRPLFDALYDTLPGEQVVRRIASGEFEVAPLAFMRGRTLANAFVILDEAQNTTSTQMKMFLTRLGENSRMVITGDLSQVDLPTGTRPGLKDAIDTLEGVPGIRFIRFSDTDVVRPPLVARIIRAYDTAGPSQDSSP